MAIQPSRVLEVHINDTEIGTLTLLGEDDRALFAFADSYKDNAMRPTLSLWYKTESGQLKTTEKIRGRALVPPVFSNLLPEGHLREYVAKKLGVSQNREFYLLAALGQDLPGAIRINSPTPLIDLTPDNIPEKSEFKGTLHFSLISIQLKLSAVEEAGGHLTIPATGEGGGWLIKLPSRNRKNLTEAEYSMLELAKRVGIAVPEFKMMKASDITGIPDDIVNAAENCLAVKRFDRPTDGNRVHMENFAQIFGVHTFNDESAKYTNGSFKRIGTAIYNECGLEDFLDYIKRLVFGVMIGNGDMHLKNWTLLYKDGRNPKLSPAYDLVPTIIYLPDDDLGLELGGTMKFTEVSETNFRTIAARAGASEQLCVNMVRETREKVIDTWKASRDSLPLPEDRKKALEAHMNKMILNHVRPKRRW